MLHMRPSKFHAIHLIDLVVALAGLTSLVVLPSSSRRANLSATNNASFSNPAGRPGSEATTRPLSSVSRLFKPDQATQAQVGESSTSGISVVDGIVVLEGDDTFMFGDRPLSIPSFTTFRLLPNAQNSFDVTAIPFTYDSNKGQLVVDRFKGDDYIEVPLGFDFPLGGQTYKSVRVSGFGGITFGVGSPQSFSFANGFNTERQYELLDTVSDPTPRLCPLFSTPIHGQIGQKQIGPQVPKYTSAYIKTEPGKAVFTWQGSGTDATLSAPINFQLVLYQSGEVLFSYKSLQGVQHGSVMAVTGRELWWESGRVIAQTNDSLPAASNQLKSAQLLQMGDTNVLLARFQSPAPLPATSSTRMDWGIEFFTNTDFRQSLGQAYARLDSSGWSEVLVRPSRLLALSREIASKSLRVTDNTVTIAIPLEEIVSPGNSFAVRFYINTPATNLPIKQTIQLDSSRDIRTDFTVLPTANSSKPIVAVYTLPSVDIIEIGNRVRSNLGASMDALFILPLFDHGDGSGGRGGNVAVDGLGSRGNSHVPDSQDNLMVSTLPRDPTDLSIIGDHIQHQFGHRWLYYISIMENGVKKDILNPDTIHPALYVHTPAAFPITSPYNASAMGGAFWQENNDGTFSPVYEPVKANLGFSWTELYLMGLASASEVPDWFYIRDFDAKSFFSTGKTTGTKVPVSIQQVIAANGARNPDSQNSKKVFLSLLFCYTGAVSLSPQSSSLAFKYSGIHGNQYLRRVSAGERAYVPVLNFHPTPADQSRAWRYILETTKADP